MRSKIIRLFTCHHLLGATHHHRDTENNFYLTIMNQTCSGWHWEIGDSHLYELPRHCWMKGNNCKSPLFCFAMWSYIVLTFWWRSHKAEQLPSGSSWYSRNVGLHHQDISSTWEGWKVSAWSGGGKLKLINEGTDSPQHSAHRDNYRSVRGGERTQQVRHLQSGTVNLDCSAGVCWRHWTVKLNIPLTEFHTAAVMLLWSRYHYTEALHIWLDLK